VPALFSLLSQLFHFSAYSIKEPKMQLNKGMLIISIDVDVGSRQLGIMNRGKNDANVNNYISEYQVGKLEETAIASFVETFNDFEIPVTFAVRGQLTEVNDSILELLLKSSIKHDIGAHGYYHKKYTNLSRNEAEKELNMISSGIHIWFHLWNFGKTRESIYRTIDKVFIPLFRYGKKKERKGMLTFETMLSAAKEVELMPIGGKWASTLGNRLHA